MRDQREKCKGVRCMVKIPSFILLVTVYLQFIQSTDVGVTDYKQTMDDIWFFTCCGHVSNIYIFGFFLAILMVEGLWFKDRKEVSHSCMSNLLLKRQLIIFKWSYLIHLSCKKRIVLNTCTYYWTKKGADWQFWTKVKQTKIHFVLSSFNYSNLSLEFLLENLQSIKFTM